MTFMLFRVVFFARGGRVARALALATWTDERVPALTSEADAQKDSGYGILRSIPRSMRSFADGG